MSTASNDPNFLQTLLNEATTVVPAVLTAVQEFENVFGNHTAVSPVPALLAAAQGVVSGITANLMLVDLQAEAQYQSVVGSNPNIETNPTEVSLTVWAQLVQAASALTAVNVLQRTLAAYSLAVNTWAANNSGSLTPSAVPGVPAALVQYQ